MSINFKNEYPRTPENFHYVVVETVQNIDEQNKSVRKKTPFKVAVLAAAIVMILTVSAFGVENMYDYFGKDVIISLPKKKVTFLLGYPIEF